ncbi:LacI family DNA-binding transcriptional regulator [Pseudooceanicola sp.]|uniref:LacI family DNA-binding transcriptional regulator n=1 Tax=Pseudooceanicola sp. TaxID=1914328 RepID=UPI0035C76935
MSAKKITIRDVARHAGVSVGTASRAMNAAPGVMEQTRKTVQAAAQDLGYRPNAAARALRSRSSRLIGCLFSDLENPLYMRLFNSLQDRWAEAGFVTLMTSSSGRLEREHRAIATFAERGLDAIVIAPGHEADPELVRLLTAFPGPIFVVDRDTPVEADRLLFDHAGAMRLAVNHLAGLGHRRILPVFSHVTTRPGLMRHAGFDAAMRAADLPLGPRVEPETPNSPVFDEVRAALSAPDRPTAMVVQGTRVLSSALNALANLGLRVPEDVSLVAIGDSALTEDHVPPITSLRLDREAMVDVIVNRVLMQIRDGRSDVQDSLLEYELIERASCARLT